MRATRQRSYDRRGDALGGAYVIRVGPPFRRTWIVACELCDHAETFPAEADAIEACTAHALEHVRRGEE